MRTTLRLVTLAALVAAGAMLAGCPESDPKQPAPTGSTSAAASGTPAPTNGSSGSGW